MLLTVFVRLFVINDVHLYTPAWTDEVISSARPHDTVVSNWWKIQETVQLLAAVIIKIKVPH